jgi:acetyl/propionyl-CoA carboxylase alpha subunit
MKHQWKVSGKKFTADDQSLEALETAGWKLSRRPGGWVIAERVHADGSVERVRGVAIQGRGKFSAQWFDHSGFHGPFFGDWSKLDASRGAGAAAASAADFTAQFPGKVRKVLVADGATVAENQKLLLVEAMKMEFAIQAPCAGVVKKIRVSEGQQLSPGDLMVDFEAAPNGAIKGAANGA